MPGFLIDDTGGNSAVNPDGKVEVKRSYRWLLTLTPSAGVDSARVREAFIYLESASRPGWNNDAIKQHHNQEEIKHIGKTVWGAIDIVFYDAENPNVSEILWDWLLKSTNNIPDANPQKPSVYKQTCDLTLLNHMGTPIEKWTLYHAWSTKTAPTAVSYANAELLKWTSTIEYDRAVRRTAAVDAPAVVSGL